MFPDFHLTSLGGYAWTDWLTTCDVKHCSYMWVPVEFCRKYAIGFHSKPEVSLSQVLTLEQCGKSL